MSTLGWLLLAGGIVAASLTSSEGIGVKLTLAVASIVGCMALATAVILQFLPLHPQLKVNVVASPVGGAWQAMNSPASRVPSHGVHSLGQTFAIDLIYAPAGLSPQPRKGMRRPEEFPSFRRPIHAPADGTVVTTYGRGRDHLSRVGSFAMAYMFIEAMFRQLCGTYGLFGNHITLDIGKEKYAVLAHLRKGSILVKKGQEVHEGELLAECGNSGNSSEPHLHFQLMDHPRATVAMGIPFSFKDIELEGRIQTTVPANKEIFRGLHRGITWSPGP